MSDISETEAIVVILVEMVILCCLFYVCCTCEQRLSRKTDNNV